MEKRLIVLAELPDFLQWLHNADFVVDMDDRTKESVGSESFLQLFEVYQAGGELNRKIRNFEAHIFQPPAGVKDTFVINLSGDYVLFFVAVELGDTLNSHIITFGGTTRENDLLCLGTNNATDILSGILTCHLGIPSKLMGF